MPTRIQIVLSAADRELFRRHAIAEGLSLSAWIRRAAHRWAQSAGERHPLDTPERLREFFDACDQRESGREPDWDEHLEVMRRSRSGGSTGT
jgi:hypothetical protein